MADNAYHFITHWRLRARIEEVADIIEDSEALPRWWPSVYLDVRTLEPGGAHGLGRVVRLFTKGWLPYTLRWDFTCVEVDYPRGSRLEARGDFVGRGIWKFVQDGDFTDAVYDWQLRAEKPLLKALTPLLRPVFSANHRWAMARGQESLALELLRRRATTEAERAAVPAPPGPTFYRERAPVPAAPPERLQPSQTKRES